MKGMLRLGSPLLIVALSAGCAGRIAPLPAVQDTVLASSGSLRIAQSLTCANQALFVPNFTNSTISVIDPGNGALLSTFSGGGLSGPTGAAYKPATNLLYVPNWWTTTISIFNAQTGAPAGLITNGNLIGPYGAVLGSNGKLYVANTGSTTVSVFDTTNNNAVLAPITGLRGPAGLALDGNRLYVSNYFGNTISIFDTANNNALVGTLSGFSAPFGVGFSGSTLYVVNERNDTVSVIDTAHGNALSATLRGNGLNQPFGLALDSKNVYVVDAATDAVSAFSLSSNAAAGKITGAGLDAPYGIAVGCAPLTATTAPNCSNAIFVPNYGDNSVTILDAATHSLVTKLTGGGLSGPTGIGYDATKQFLYVSNWDNETVSVFNAVTNAPVGVISGGGINGPYGATVGKEGRLYIANLGTLDGRAIVRFDTNNGNALLPPIWGSGVAGVAVGVGRLYASNYFDDTIGVFDTTNGDAPVTTITAGGLDHPFGLAAVGLDLYAGNYASSSHLIEYDSTKAYAQVTTVTGNGLNWPLGMGFDATTIYAVDSNGILSDFSVLGAAPLGTIPGANFNQPYGIATGLTCKPTISAHEMVRHMQSSPAQVLGLPVRAMRAVQSIDPSFKGIAKRRFGNPATMLEVFDSYARKFN